MILIRPLTTKLIDFTGSDYIPIEDGDVIIWKDSDYLRHTTNLTIYLEIAEETEKLTDHFPSSHMVKILESDIKRIRSLLESLYVHHRHARSINMLGTALKIIAGTPDFDDFEGQKFRQRELINSVNEQILINTKTQDQINKLTDTVNKIIENSKPENIHTGYLYETLLARNRIIITEIETLMLSITLVKVGIINPVLLDSNDLKEILQISSTNTTVTDLLEVSLIKVLLYNEMLYFLIKYPKPRLVCKKIILHPVQHNGTILHLAETNNVANCGNRIIAIGNCTTTLTSSFCQEYSQPTCAQQLHAGIVAHCSTRPSHLKPLEIVDDGVMIINDNTAVVKDLEGTVTKVSGTYLITFESEISVNGSIYKNQRAMLKKVPTSATSTVVNVTSHQEILSLPYLQRLNFENLQYINEVKNRTITGPVVSGLVTITLILSLYIAFKLCQRRTVKCDVIEAVIDSYKRPEDGPHLSGGGVNTV